jgi:hypothetical protein
VARAPGLFSLDVKSAALDHRGRERTVRGVIQYITITITVHTVIHLSNNESACPYHKAQSDDNA